MMRRDEVVARCKAGEPIVIQLGDDAANPILHHRVQSDLRGFGTRSVPHADVPQSRVWRNVALLVASPDRRGTRGGGVG